MTHRAHFAGPISKGTSLVLEGDCFQHLCKVLRARVGDRVILFNGDGQEYGARLESIEKRSATASVLDVVEVSRTPTLQWQLVQSISKGDRMDYTLQKAAELGVHSIRPVISDRSVVRLDDDRAERRRAHWQGVVRSACEQCGMNRLPEIMAISSLSEALTSIDADTRLLLDPEASVSISDVDIRGRVALLTGPEGGFGESEIAAAKASGFKGVRMGQRVLRTETAALVAAAVLLSRSGDLD